MANQLVLDGLLKTPDQVRKEQQQQLRNEAFQRSQQMISGGGTTALPGLISRYGAQAAQRGVEAGAGLLRGITGGIGTAVGGELGRSIQDLGVSTEERQARQAQEAMKGMVSDDPTSIKATAMKLRQLGLTSAADQLDQRARRVEMQEQEIGFKKQEQERADTRLDMERERLTLAKEQAATAQEKADLDKQISQLTIDQANFKMDQLKDAKNDQDLLKTRISEMLPTIDDTVMSPELKETVKMLPPTEGFNFISKALSEQNRKAQTTQLMTSINGILRPAQSVEGSVAVDDSIEGINNRYNAAIQLAERSNDPELAQMLKDERKVIVEEKGKVRDIEESRRKDFRSDAMAKTQRGVIEQSRKGLEFLKSGTGAGDIAGIIQFMKGLDPNSVVRESEFAVASSIGSYLDSFKTAFKGWGTGDRLTPEQRDALSNVLVVAAQTAAQDYNAWRSNEMEAFSGRGYDAEYIVGKELVAPTYTSTSTENTEPTQEEAARAGEGF
jgi:hypothetical protein